MNSELQLRLSQIKQYISSLQESISVNNHLHASTVVSRFKKAMSKCEEHVHANQFILDCLRTRHEKLRNQLIDLTQEKRAIEAKLAVAKTAPREIQKTQAEICLTRLTLSLADSKKVDYEEVTLRSDYKHIFVKSVVGEKYKDYALSLEEAQQLEQRANLLYFCAIGQQVLHVIVRFRNERDAYRWATCLRHGQLALTNARKKDRLFEEHKDPPPQPQPQPLQPPPHISSSLFGNTASQPPPLRSSTVKHSLGVPQSSIPFLNFGGGQSRISPTESGISDKRFTEKSFALDDRPGEKNTERSLMNALNNEGIQSSGTFNMREQAGGHANRLDLNRPPNLLNTSNTNKVRNNSHDFAGMVDALKGKSGYRKQSEDTIKPRINQAYHQKMMENYRSQEEQEQARSESTYFRPQEKTARLLSLQERKRELLKAAPHPAPDKPAFAFDNKVAWMGIEEMDDQNKSKSSNRPSNKSHRNSEVSESIIPASIDQYTKRDTAEERHSEHITQKSQEESPRLPPRQPAYQVPTKIAYNNGIVFQLHQVEKGATTSPLLPPDSPNPPLRPSSPSSSSLDSDDDHSDPSSHENHTESEDNNARSQQLKKGIILTKCSQGGFWTHEKILYLSENNSEVCSRDLKDKKIKKIKIANIKQVEYRKFDKGIIKHVSKIEEDKCLVIRALDEEGNLKNYQFVGNLAEPLERFANSLKLFVEYSKKE